MSTIWTRKKIGPDELIKTYCTKQFRQSMTSKYSLDDAVTAVSTITDIAYQNDPKRVDQLKAMLAMGSNVQHEYLVTAKDDEERAAIYKRCDRTLQALALAKKAAVFYAGYKMESASGEGLVKAIEIGFHAMGPALEIATGLPGTAAVVNGAATTFDVAFKIHEALEDKEIIEKARKDFYKMLDTPEALLQIENAPTSQPLGDTEVGVAASIDGLTEGSKSRLRVETQKRLARTVSYMPPDVKIALHFETVENIDAFSRIYFHKLEDARTKTTTGSRVDQLSEDAREQIAIKSLALMKGNRGLDPKCVALNMARAGLDAIAGDTKDIVVELVDIKEKKSHAAGKKVSNNLPTKPKIAA